MFLEPLDALNEFIHERMVEIFELLRGPLKNDFPLAEEKDPV